MSCFVTNRKIIPTFLLKTNKIPTHFNSISINRKKLLIESKVIWNHRGKSKTAKIQINSECLLFIYPYVSSDHPRSRHQDRIRWERNVLREILVEERGRGAGENL